MNGRTVNAAHLFQSGRLDRKGPGREEPAEAQRLARPRKRKAQSERHLCFFLLSAAGITLAVALAMSSVQGIVLVGFLNGDSVRLGQRDELSAWQCVEAVGGRGVG